MAKITLPKHIVSLYKSGVKTTDTLIINWIFKQVIYLLEDIKWSHFSGKADPLAREKAHENLRLLVFYNLPKHFVVVIVCLIIPLLRFPGGTGVGRYIIHNNKFLRKRMKLEFQERPRKLSKKDLPWWD